MRRWWWWTVLLAAVVALSLVPAPVGIDAAPVEPLRLNHFQVKGSHNSFHIEHAPEVIDSYMTVNPTAYRLAFTHPPLADQLDLGFRQFEFDVFTDPAGDRFPPIGTPGFKALHIEAIDEGSQCPLFTDCLRDLEAWSDAHPQHMPIAVLIEPKEGFFTPTGPVTPADLVALDAEIRSVLDPDQLVTPDFVKGVGRAGGADGQGTVYPDVESAILEAGWPLLDDTRQRFIFLLNNERDDYVNGDTSLAGRVAFPPSSPGRPDAAFVRVNDPEGANQDEIRELVAEGYIVRTRSDLPVDTGLTGDHSQLEAALASGAHWVSGDYLSATDYARYDAVFAARYGQPFDPNRPAYLTAMPGGASARCNPITAPPGCETSDIEAGLPVILLPVAVGPTATPVAVAPVVSPVAVKPSFTG